MYRLWKMPSLSSWMQLHLFLLKQVWLQNFLPLLLQQVLLSPCQMWLDCLCCQWINFDWTVRVHFDTVTPDSDKCLTTDLLNAWQHLVHSWDVQKVLLNARPLLGHLCKGKFLNQYLYRLNVNEHWHLEFIADIAELVMPATFSLVL